jgi:hypothetical protein
MATSLEKFLLIKKQIESGQLELNLPDFGNAFSTIKELFSDLAFDMSITKVLESTDSKLRFEAFSKDFLFRKTLFKNESVQIETDITLAGNELEIIAICKMGKSPKKLSKLPGIIGDLLKPLDFISIDDMVYIFTSKEITLIKSTVFAAYNDKKVQLKPGINLAGFVDLQNSGSVVSQVIKPLKPIIGTGPYFMSWNMKDKANIDFSLNLPQDIDIESVFKIKQPRLVLKPVKLPEISLDGLFDIKLPGVASLALEGGFTYRADGITGKFNLDNIAEKLPAPFGYPGVHMSTLTLTAGFINGIAVAGAEGQFYIGPKKPGAVGGGELGGLKSNEYKFMFQAIPGKVTPVFCYFYLNLLTFEEYLKALTNKNIELPSFLNKIKIEQLMFHWCELPQGEPKPDGTMANPLFGFSGITNIFGHKTFTEIQADAQGNSKGKLIADPINISNGLLKITGKGNGTPEKYKGGTKVKPGGIELAFSSDGKPAYFSFSTAVEVLGISGDLEGAVSETGLSGKMKSNVAGIIKNELNLVYDNQYFEVKTGIDAKISGLKISLDKLGTLKLNTALQGDFNAIFKNDNYSNSMKLSFEFIGMKFDLGTITVSVKDLTKIVQELEELIRKKILEEFTQDVLKWLTAVLKGAIEFAGEKMEEVGKALNKVFTKTLDESAKLLKKAGYTAEEVGKALYKGFEAGAGEVAVAMRQVGYTISEIATMLKKVYQLEGHICASVFRAMKYTVVELGTALKEVYGLSDKATVAIMKNLGYTIDDCAEVMTKVFNTAKAGVSNILREVGYPVKETERVVKKFFRNLTGGRCMLSSAAIEFKGMEDNCNELELLRKFRDEYMLHLPDGLKLIEEYYDLSDTIMEKVEGTPQESIFQQRIYDQLILPSIKLIREEKMQEAFTYYRQYVINLYEETTQQKYNAH